MSSMQPAHFLIIFVIVLATFLLRRRLQENLFDGKPSAARRRWEWIGAPFALVWMGSMIALAHAIAQGSFSRLYLVLGVVGCALAGVAHIWWMYRWQKEADELVRKIETEALALGLGLGVLGIVALDQLTSAGIMRPPGSSTPGVRIMMPVILGYVFARVFVYQRYR